jgi:hypothetical protein
MLLAARLVAGVAWALLLQDLNFGGPPQPPWNPCDVLALS